MQLEFDLAIGDVIRVGDHTVMIVDIQEHQVTLKVCGDDGSEHVQESEPYLRPTRPR